MKLSEIKEVLKTVETVTFQLPNGNFCSRAFSRNRSRRNHQKLH